MNLVGTVTALVGTATALVGTATALVGTVTAREIKKRANISNYRSTFA